MPGDGHVDVSYRGLAVGSGLVMREFGPTTAYVVDVGAPMPVGTTLEIAADDGVRFAARVVHVREKTEDVPCGAMRVAVEGIDEAARAWWDARVTTEDPAPIAAPARVVAAPAPAAAVPAPAEVETTEASEAPELAEPAAQAVPQRAAPESRSTQMMDAVDLAEIQRLAAGVSAEDFAAREAEAAAAGVTDDDDDKKKKRKRRRKKRG